MDTDLFNRLLTPENLTLAAAVYATVEAFKRAGLLAGRYAMLAALGVTVALGVAQYIDARAGVVTAHLALGGAVTLLYAGAKRAANDPPPQG